MSISLLRPPVMQTLYELHEEEAMGAARPAPGSQVRLNSAGWTGLLLLGALFVGSLVDLAAPGRLALLPLVVAPFIAAVTLPLRATALMAGLSLVLCVVLPQAFVTDAGYQWLRFAAVAALDLLAVVSALWRERLVDIRIRLAQERERRVQARRHALELNDQIYQALFASKVWARMGEERRSEEAFDRAFQGTADILGELLGDIPVHPGSFVRSGAVSAAERAAETTA